MHSTTLKFGSFAVELSFQVKRFTPMTMSIISLNAGRVVFFNYRLNAKLLLLMTFCLLLLPLWESVIVLCFVVSYFMSILVLQSS